MKKIALVLMVVTIFSKILGISREIVLAYYYGASNVSDAYIISITIPLVLFSFVGAGLATSYIPLYNKIEKEKGIESANRFTSIVTNFIFILCTLMVFIVLILANPIVKLFASGFEGEILDLAVTFTRISIIGIYFSGLIIVYKSYLQIKNVFIIPALLGIPLSIFTILSIVISFKYNLILLSIGSVIAIAAQLLLLLLFVFKKGFKYHLILDRNNEYVKKIITLAIPVSIGVSIGQINALVDNNIASNISVGGISALNYALKLNNFVHGIVVVSIITVMYPIISKMVADNNMIGVKKSVGDAINGINLLVIPATVGSMIFAEPIVRLMFGRGAFDSLAISLTSNAWFFYSIGLFAYGIIEVLSNAFYSLQDTKTPMINGAISMLLNIALSIILSKYLGVGGVALATSISAIFFTGLLFFSLRRKIGAFGLKKIIATFIKILFSSLIMGVVSKLLFISLNSFFHEVINLFISMLISVVVYFVVIYFMKIEDMNLFINYMKLKIK